MIPNESLLNILSLTMSQNAAGEFSKLLAK